MFKWFRWHHTDFSVASRRPQAPCLWRVEQKTTSNYFFAFIISTDSKVSGSRAKHLEGSHCTEFNNSHIIDLKTKTKQDHSPIPPNKQLSQARLQHKQSCYILRWPTSLFEAPPLISGGWRALKGQLSHPKKPPSTRLPSLLLGRGFCSIEAEILSCRSGGP